MRSDQHSTARFSVREGGRRTAQHSTPQSEGGGPQATGRRSAGPWQQQQLVALSCRYCCCGDSMVSTSSSSYVGTRGQLCVKQQ